ncbi:MAG: hypothetical protein WCP16_06390 [Pseudanabaena sp. ELA645]
MIALLATTLATADAVSAINLTVSNTVSNTFGPDTFLGQSFRNDPSGSASPVTLNSWTFAFADLTNANAAQALTLSIYNGVGNGGLKVGDSTGAATTTFAGFNSVIWSFSGLPQLTDTSTYTAVINNSSLLSVPLATSSTYSNGNFTARNVSVTTIDTVFQGDFSSATPVPFEFEPTGGLMVLGGGWLLRRHLRKKKSTKV